MHRVTASNDSATGEPQLLQRSITCRANVWSSLLLLNKFQSCNKDASPLCSLQIYFLNSGKQFISSTISPCLRRLKMYSAVVLQPLCVSSI